MPITQTKINRTISLPIQKDIIIQQVPRLKTNPWRKIQGIWKDKKLVDPLKWQDKIRKESDQRIANLKR